MSATEQADTTAAKRTDAAPRRTGRTAAKKKPAEGPPPALRRRGAAPGGLHTGTPQIFGLASPLFPSHSGTCALAVQGLVRSEVVFGSAVRVSR